VRRALVTGVVAAALGLVALPCGAQTASDVRVYAAGSLRAALNEVGRDFEALQPGRKVVFTFGASGLLKDRLAGGEAADVFASANMEHPQALGQAGRAGATQRFARNALCALHRPGLAVTPDTLARVMLDAGVKLGTSTPKADPAGDYTWELFQRIEQAGAPGAYAQLSAKALQLTGGPQSPPPPANRNVYGALMAQGAADLFITYCTNAVIAVMEEPTLRWVDVPPAIAVSASYGVALMNGASADAQAFVEHLLAPQGQAVLARHGFSAR